uniref:Secreted protein n=1 Tax=Ascaris lumbricoides TaxID=6252 RepID=A0A0M3HV19_ASCLU
MKFISVGLLLATSVVKFIIGIECGYGYRTTPWFDGSKFHLPKQGFTRKTCNITDYCATLKILPIYIGNVKFSAQLKYCDNDIYPVNQYMPAGMTCKDQFSGKDGCKNYLIYNPLIPYLPPNVTAEWCCCKDNDCNCNTWNWISEDYCSRSSFVKLDANALNTSEKEVAVTVKKLTSLLIPDAGH